jgi:pyruvate-ferredoxin/flavodoxin oxidoreductase
LMRYNPALRLEGKNPFQLDSKAPSIPLKDYVYQEARYTILARGNPEAAARLLREAQEDVQRRWRVYESRAAMPGNGLPDDKRPEDLPQKPELVAAGAPEGGAK